MVVSWKENMASRYDNHRVCSVYVANLASLFSHFLMPVDNSVCQGNRCQLRTAIASASCINSTSNGRTFHCRNQVNEFQCEEGFVCVNV